MSLGAREVANDPIPRKLGAKMQNLQRHRAGNSGFLRHGSIRFSVSVEAVTCQPAVRNLRNICASELKRTPFFLQVRNTWLTDGAALPHIPFQNNEQVEP